MTDIHKAFGEWLIPQVGQTTSEKHSEAAEASSTKHWLSLQSPFQYL